MSEVKVGEKHDPGEFPSETLLRLLNLAAAEQLARNSALWKTNMDMAFELHGDAVDALYEALYSELDRREGIVPPKAKKVDPVKAAKAAILKRLREQLPVAVQNILETDNDF